MGFYWAREHYPVGIKLDNVPAFSFFRNDCISVSICTSSEEPVWHSVGLLTNELKFWHFLYIFLTTALNLRIMFQECRRSCKNAQVDICWTSGQGAPWMLWAQWCLFLAPGFNIKRQQNTTFNLCFLLTLALFCFLLVLLPGESGSSFALPVASGSKNRGSVYGWNWVNGRSQRCIESWVADDRKSGFSAC